MTKWSKVQVACGAFLTNFFIGGPMQSLGVYFLVFQLDLNASAQEASMVISILYGTYFFTGPLVTVMCSIFGYKWTCLIGTVIATLGVCLSSISTSIGFTYLTLGVCLGAGCCMVVTTMFALVGQLFSDERPLVNNILTLGSAVSSIPLNLLAQIWIDLYGWRGSLLLMGGFALNTLPAILFTFNGASRCNAEQKSTRQKMFDTSLLKSFPFMLYCLACSMYVASSVVVYTYLTRYAQSQGIDSIAAAGLVSIIGAVSIALTPLGGYVVSLKTIGSFHVNRSYILSATLFIQSATAFILPFATDYLGVVIVVVIYAASSGIAGAMPITVLSDLFGTENLLTSLGMRSFLIGAVSLASPPLIGIAVDASDSFSYPFFFSAILSFMSGVCFVVVYLCVSPLQDLLPAVVEVE